MSRVELNKDYLKSKNQNMKTIIVTPDTVAQNVIYFANEDARHIPEELNRALYDVILNNKIQYVKLPKNAVSINSDRSRYKLGLEERMHKAFLIRKRGR